MSGLDRRKFLRVLFEAYFEVRATEWSDREATGLDISLNGCRFNCKQAMTDGEQITIIFKSGLELEGSVRWCWPIEWYFQAALNFEDITKEKQAMLKTYIEEVTGEDYKMQKDQETAPDNIVESVEILDEDLDDLDDDLSASIIDLENQEVMLENYTEEDELEELPPLEEEDLLNLDIEEPIDGVSDLSNTKQNDEISHEIDEGEINTLSFAGKHVVLYDLVKDQAKLLIQYLSERAGMEVEHVSKKENLWRLQKIDPIDLLIIETGATSNSDALEVMQQTKDQFIEIKIVCISGPVSLERRLQFLNAGALDYLTRPLHLSTIAQSILVHLSHSVVADLAEDVSPQGQMIAVNKELQEELTLMTKKRDEAIANAKANAVERDEAKAAKVELEQRAHYLAEEKESLYLDETSIPDAEPISDPGRIYPIEDLNGPAILLDEDLKISEEVDLIEEDY